MEPPGRAELGWKADSGLAELSTGELPVVLMCFFSFRSILNLSSLLSLWPIPSSAWVFPTAPEDVTKPEHHRWGREVMWLGA